MKFQIISLFLFQFILNINCLLPQIIKYTTLKPFQINYNNNGCNGCLNEKKVKKEEFLKSFSHNSHNSQNNSNNDNLVLKYRGGQVVLSKGIALLSYYFSLVKDYTNTISPTSFKILLQTLLTSFNILCWIIPFSRGTFLNNSYLLSLANSFSAGIFLMLALTHMIPHALEVLQNNKLNPMFAFKYSVLGYLLILSLEKIFFDPTFWSNQQSLSNNNTTEGDKNEKDSNSIVQNRKNSSLIVVLAMAIHSFFESIALGMSSDRSSALMMASSIGLHQPAESMALLVSLLKTSLKKSSILLILSLFSLVGPLGSYLGTLLTTTKLPLLESALISITAGTFLYASTTEIIPEEFNSNNLTKEKLQKYISLLLGIILISFLS